MLPGRRSGISFGGSAGRDAGGGKPGAGRDSRGAGGLVVALVASSAGGTPYRRAMARPARIIPLPFWFSFSLKGLRATVFRFL